MGDIVTKTKDLRHLSWSESAPTSGTGGSFLKASDGTGTNRVYYKLSSYDYYRGVFGHECMNELIASRLLKLLGIPHASYFLIQGLVRVDGRDFITWVSASKSYRHPSDRKIAFDTFYRQTRVGNENPLQLCDRLGWGVEIRQILFADYLICNRDRHGANIEVVRHEDGSLNLSPVFDNGVSLVFSCYGSEERAAAFDVMGDYPANNFVGSRSLEENLALVEGWDLRIKPLGPNWEECVFEGLGSILPPAHLRAIDTMISQRWERAYPLLSQGRAHDAGSSNAGLREHERIGI